MQANRSLTEQEKLSIISAITFKQSAVINLKVCLPIVREEDATQLQSLIDLGELPFGAYRSPSPKRGPRVGNDKSSPPENQQAKRNQQTPAP